MYTRGLRWDLLRPSWCKEIKRLRRCEYKNGMVEWKTAFYHLAKATGATVFVIGIDYGRGLIVSGYGDEAHDIDRWKIRITRSLRCLPFFLGTPVKKNIRFTE